MTQNKIHGYDKHNAHAVKFKVHNVISYLYFSFCNFFLNLGTVITKLKMVTNTSVRYRLVSGSEDVPLFAVDNQGQLSLARTLDRELRDSHVVAVLAETDSSPPLTALAEVTLKVLDENDHAPEFESSPYRLTLAENVEEGTSILKGMFLFSVIR